MSRDSSKEFNKISQEYDKGRVSEDVTFWAKEAEKIANLSNESLIADMGCGTGNYGIGIIHISGATVVGFDPVTGLLAQAKLKNTSIMLIRAVSEWMPFKNSSFDLIYAAQVWHHVQGRKQSAEENYRILKNNGVKIAHTISHKQIKTKTVFKFFPEILEGQLKAYPSDEEFITIFSEAGFKKIKVIPYQIKRYQKVDEFVEIAEKKLWSMFRPISQIGLEKGICELKKWKQEHDDAPVRNDELITLFIAIK